jgi:hypothetical protein
VGHASIDWDWQLPGLVIPALLIAAAVIARASDVRDGRARFAGRRVAMGLPALLAMAWLAHDWRAVQLQREASQRIEAVRVLGLDQKRYAEILSLLEGASWLNPDNAPRRGQAITMILAGKTAQARELLESITESDPYDFQAWKLLLYLYSSTGDEARYNRAALVLSSFHRSTSPRTPPELTPPD